MKRRCHNSTNGTGGFTLMEVMIAAILVTVVLSAVYTLFYSTITSWRGVEQGYDIHKEGRNFASLMQREINNILPDGAHLFTGEDDEFTMFVVSEPLEVEDTSGRHVMRVRYFYDRGDNAIMREEALVESPLPRPIFEEGVEIDRSRIKVADEEEFTVAEHVQDFEVRYLWVPWPEERNPDDPPIWVEPVLLEEHRELWRVGYPNAIEIRATLADPDAEDENYTFSITMPIRLDRPRWTREVLSDRIGRAF